MSKRLSEEEILTLIEEGGDEALEALAAEDPGLARWVRAAKRDRETMLAMGRSPEREMQAPEGLVEDALAEAERRALVGTTTHAPGRRERAGRRTPAGHRRLRVTPLGVTIAAALFIAAGAATVLPVLIGQPGPGLGPSGPVAMQEDEPDEQLASEPGDAIALADRLEGPAGPAQDMIGSAAAVSGNADDSVGPAQSAGARTPDASTSARAAASPDEDAPKAPPPKALAPDLPTAEESEWLTLAKEGRLGVVARSWPSDGYEQIGGLWQMHWLKEPTEKADAVGGVMIDATPERVQEAVRTLLEIGGEWTRAVELQRDDVSPAMEPEQVFWWTQPWSFTERERASILLLAPISGE